jgi:lysophospholipase L1-like esterase
MHTTKFWQLASVLCLLCNASIAQTQTTPPKTMTEPKPALKHLVVIGASYAGNWGQPELPGYRITNKGVGGEESWQVASRFERDGLSLKPDAILIWGHINDITRTTPDRYSLAKERAVKSYQQMLAQARSANVTVYLATELTRPTAVGWRDWIPATIGRIRGKESYDQMVNREVKEINTWLRKTAAQENLTLLDFEQALDDGDGGRRLEYTLEDRSHVSAAGYAAVTQHARTKLSR